MQWAGANAVAGVLLVIGGALDGDARVWLWVAAMVVVLAATITAGRSDWVIRPGHFGERHGLIVIVALGEVVVALATPVADSLEEGQGFSGTTVTGLIAAGVFVCVLWWAYFDRPEPAFEHHNESLSVGRARAAFARDVYTWWHLPLVAGVILSAAAVEEIILHPSDPAPTGFRWMLFAGLAAYLVAVVVPVGHWFSVVAIERVIAIAALLAVTLAGGSLDALVLLIVVDIVLLAMLLVEHGRIEKVDRPLHIGHATRMS